MFFRVVPWCVLLSLAVVGCGKKGPPLAPLNLVPEAATSARARRLGDTVYLQMSVPQKNANGPGPVALDHLEIYAVTAAPGVHTPSNRELFAGSRIIARIPVKPPVDPDEPPAEDDAPKDTRPGPGDTITFAEILTEAQLKPQILPAPGPANEASAPTGAPAAASGTAAPATPVTAATGTPDEDTPAPPSNPPAVAAVPAAGGTSIGGAPTATTPSPEGSAAQTAPAAAPSAAAPPAPAPPPSVPTRIYIVRGITKRGRAGSPSARLVVPLVSPPPVATALATAFTETAVKVTWFPPVAEGPSAPPMSFNVYSAAPKTDSGETAAPTPLNDQPLSAPSFEHAGVAPDVEQCFVVRTVQTIAGTAIESEPSAPACVTPRDTFPPAAPKGLSAVAGPGAVNLIWDANTEQDLAGYLVLRAETPDDTLQPLMSEPTRDTRYRDTTVKPGVRYVYAIVAVDRAGNRSPASPRVEETAR